MSIDLSHLLGKKTSDIEKPKPFPVGHYTWVISTFGIVTSSQKKTPGIELECKMVTPMDDVDTDELAEVKNVSERKQKLTLWLTEDSLWRVKEFFEILGIQDDEKTLEELLPEVVSQTFVAAIKHEPIEGSSDVIAKIDDRTVQAAE